MRVVFVTATFPSDHVHFRALAKEVDLTVYGTTFSLTPSTQAVARPPEYCKVRCFTPFGRIRRGSALWAYPGLFKALTEDAPDVVHVVSEPWGFLSLQASLWCRRHPQTALVLHGTDRTGWHGVLPERLGKRVLARSALRRSDAHAGESAKTLHLARRAGLARDAPTSSIHTNPRDPEAFRPATDEDERRQLRRSLGVPPDGIGVGFMGHLSPRKAPLLFLDALREVRGNGHVWAVIAGSGALKDEVERMARTQGVRCFHDLKFPAQVSAFYRSLDVFAIPSRTTHDWEEQGPRVVIEAMMSSCLVVGSDSGAIPEMLGDFGIVVRENDTADLAGGIARAIQQANDWDLRRGARNRAIAEYSGASVATKLIHLWGEAKARRSQLSSQP
jgi:glycosyltransferase involved in cell wall biosynthesis